MRLFSYLFFFALLFNKITACKKKANKPAEPGIEQCSRDGSFDFGMFFASLSLRLLDLTGVPIGTAGWIIVDAISSTESPDYQYFDCIMRNVKNALRNYHEESLILDFEKVMSELSILKLRHPPPKKIPEYKLENLLTDLRSGAIGLKPISNIRVNEHLLILIPIWAALNLDVYKLLLQQTSNKPAVKREMDVMTIFYSQLILRSWRKVRELSCVEKPLCYQEYGPSPAKVYVPGLLENVNLNTNKFKLQAILDKTILKDEDIISLRMTYHVRDGQTLHHCSDHYQGKWLSCENLSELGYYYDLNCSEKNIFDLKCADEQFKINGINKGKIKSGDEVEVVTSKEKWWDASVYARDGMYTTEKKTWQEIHLNGIFTDRTGRNIDYVYDGDIISFGRDASRFQVFIKNSESGFDPSDLKAPGLE